MLKKKTVLISGLVLCIAIIGLVFVIQKITAYNRLLYCGPGGCPDPTLRHTDKPQYKEKDGYGTDSGGFACSKPIRMISNTLDKNGEYVSFQPVDQEEARVFCHMTSAIEYKGKLKVLQKPEVLALISKYQYKDVSIKALEFKYIEDKDFVHRLLPVYKDREIGCIIVLETPGEKKVYLEDEKLDTFEELNYKTFEEDLGSVGEKDRRLFTENLK